jgi:hypothetical protein
VPLRGADEACRSLRGRFVRLCPFGGLRGCVARTRSDGAALTRSWVDVLRIRVI